MHRLRERLESLAESAAKIRKGIDPELRARERAVQAELNAREAYRARLRARGGGATELSEVRRDVERLLEEWRAIQAEIRERSPAYAALKNPRAVTVGEVQASLLGPGTALVEYHPGGDRRRPRVAHQYAAGAVTARRPKRSRMAKLARRRQ